MDPSTNMPAAGRTQPPVVGSQPGSQAPVIEQPKTAVPAQPISGHVEQGPIHTAAVAETPVDNDNEEDIQPAKQEVGAPAAPQQKEVQKVEVTPSIPEVTIEKSVENVIEKSPDTEKPEIPAEVKAVGITHSGPGVPVSENVFAVKSMPMTFQQAQKIDQETPLKDSKHWLAELVMYIWKKLDPQVTKKGVTK